MVALIFLVLLLYTLQTFVPTAIMSRALGLKACIMPVARVTSR